MKWKLEIEMKLLRKNGIRIEIKNFFRMEITLLVTLTDDETGQCVSTGNANDLYKTDNKPLLDFLTAGKFMPDGIQLPAGQ